MNLKMHLMTQDTITSNINKLRFIAEEKNVKKILHIIYGKLKSTGNRRFKSNESKYKNALNLDTTVKFNTKLLCQPIEK